MRRVGVIAAVTLAGAVLVASAAWAAEVSATTSTQPPKNLKKVGDHWTPWDPPAPGPDSYIIVKDDTLWDLAGKWLGNPHLWPQIWDQNRYILDSHWIYPGDPLGVPGKPTVVPPEGPPPAEEAAETPAAVPPAAPPEGTTAPSPAPVAPLIPLGDPSDVYCSGVIEASLEAPTLVIAGKESEREHFAEGDVVYLSLGRAQGVRAGAEYAIRRPEGTVVHPKTQAVLGTYVRRLGKIRVLVPQENTATAVVVQSCAEMAIGDGAWPWAEIPIPSASSLPEFDRWDAEPSGGPEGYVVATKDSITHTGTGHVVYTDLGASLGVRPGSVLSVYRDQSQGLPRIMLGQAVVLETREGTSTVKIVKAVKEIEIGDRVELER